MKLIANFAILLVVSLTIVLGCVKPPAYPIEPVIEFVSMSDTLLVRGVATDSVLATISFTDGNGDIGSENGENNLFYTDSRDGFELKRQIPFVPELGASNGIKGKITFFIANTCCIFPDSLFSTSPCTDEYEEYPYDRINYKVYIEDRAGNRSNEITLPTIRVQCFN